mgnify:CR=1 FL=1
MSLMGSGTAYPSWRCPVVSTSVSMLPRSVRLWPTLAAAAQTAVMPGTMSNGMPLALRAAVSSVLRAKTPGSPHFNRTTRCPRLAAATSVWVIFSCGQL